MGNKDTVKIIKNVPKENNFSFADNTTYGCGGKAKVAYFPKSIRQAVAVYDYLKSCNTNFVILGSGSNILASDIFYDGAVLSTRNLTGIYRTGQKTIFCRSGTKVGALLKYCASNGFGGLEYLAGIPASLGGLALMNGGAGGKFICDNILSVKLYNGKICNFSNKSCNFGYKYSIMRDINALILGIELEITPENVEKVKENISSYLASRSRQPKGKSCGCVFKNVNEISAGKIIDDAGLMGLSFGNASVSYGHANFIINNGESSADVYSLICEVKRRVFERTGIVLEEEVVYIGDF